MIALITISSQFLIAKMIIYQDNQSYSRMPSLYLRCLVPIRSLCALRYCHNKMTHILREHIASVSPYPLPMVHIHCPPIVTGKQIVRASCRERV